MDGLSAGGAAAATGAARRRRARRLRSDGRHLAWMLNRMQALASHHSAQHQAPRAWCADVDVLEPAGFEDVAIMRSETIVPDDLDSGGATAAEAGAAFANPCRKTWCSMEMGYLYYRMA